MEEQGTIKINTGEIRGNIRKVINNNYTFLFSLLFIAIIVLLIIKSYGIGSGITFLARLFSAFSINILLLLAGTLVLSAVLAHYGKFRFMFLPIVIWLIITTAVIRTSNIDQLKDVTTGDYTFGPDLDPFLYWRHATEISENRLEIIDHFRQAPLGVKNYAYTNIMPWIIFYFYKLFSVFSDVSLTYSAIILPVVLFIISVIGFLLFVKTISSFKMSEQKSWITAIIASIFYAFIPAMLHRTIAGIPEIESLGMVWFWFTFLFFTLAWKAKERKKQILFGVLAGIFTGAMSWSWGGYKYIYMILSLTILILFLFGKDREIIFVIFSSWITPALIFELLKIKSITTIIVGFSDVGFSAFVWFIICLDIVLSKSNIKDTEFLKKINIPDPIKSLFIGIFLAIIIALIVNPSFVANIFSSLIDGLLYPFGRGRVGLTVAENRAPYLTDIFGSFGNLFWLFLLGNVILFYEATKHFEKDKKIWLNFFFIVFIFALSFTRFSSQSMFNGENFISKFAYLGGILLFIFVLFLAYIKAHIKKDEKTTEDFSNIEFHYVLLLTFAFWAMISMRGAVRLFFIISPMLIIISSLVPVKLWGYLKNKNDDLSKMFVGIVLLIVIIFMIITFVSYAAETTVAAENIVPSSYNQQWQKAMFWVRESTPENSIFVHWWDYGFWVQTLGERPTVPDGAHANSWWDHTTARYLLTTPKPETAISLMKTHNVSYLLIDQTDLGKYSAYSSIGSDANMDRFSQIPVMVVDPSQIIESAGREARVYQGSTIVDEDIAYSDTNGSSIFLPANRAFVIGMVIEISKTGGSFSFKQPEAVFFYNNQQVRIPLRYVYYNGEIIDFKSGIEATARVMQGVNLVGGQNINIDELGSVIYLSPKVSKGLFARLYLMDDPYKEYQTLTLAHSESDPFVDSLKAQGLDLDEIVYFQGFRGPIKIWRTEYPGNILTHEEFLRSSGEYASLDNLQWEK